MKKQDNNKLISLAVLGLGLWFLLKPKTAVATSVVPSTTGGDKLISPLPIAPLLPAPINSLPSLITPISDLITPSVPAPPVDAAPIYYAPPVDAAPIYYAPPVDAAPSVPAAPIYYAPPVDAAPIYYAPPVDAAQPMQDLINTVINSSQSVPVNSGGLENIDTTIIDNIDTNYSNTALSDNANIGSLIKPNYN